MGDVLSHLLFLVGDLTEVSRHSLCYILLVWDQSGQGACRQHPRRNPCWVRAAVRHRDRGERRLQLEKPFFSYEDSSCITP